MKYVVKQDLIYNDGTVSSVNGKPILAGVYAYMRHDFESKAFYRKSWNRNVPRMLVDDKDHLHNDDGFPEMVPGKPREGVRMTYEIQWFIIKQFALAKYGIYLVGDIETQFHSRLTKTQQDYLKEAFRQTFRDDTAFTNHSGIWNKRTGKWTGRSFIHGTGSDSLPKIWENSCGGSTHLVNSKTVTNDMEWIEVKTLDPKKYGEWKDYNFIDNREFFVFGVSCTPYLVGTRNTETKTGPWKVDPMHMLGGAHVALPLMSNSGNLYFHKDRVEIIRHMTEFRRYYVN